MTPDPKRLLIVEDQKKLLRSLAQGLREESYEVVTAATGDEAYQQAASSNFDAIVLDVMLPGRSGLDVVRQLRGEGFLQPILLLTARDALADRVEGLDSGADDYLIKPFAFEELVARLRALLRRPPPSRDLILQADDLSVDLVARRVTRDGREIELTRREFDLLEFLLRHKNTVVSREMIAREVWKETTDIQTNNIEVHINMLRKKVESAGRSPLIYTVRGAGYSLRDGS
jgi:two-component system copper resistance phosphate regulon response regulator CusR